MTNPADAGLLHYSRIVQRNRNTEKIEQPDRMNPFHKACGMGVFMIPQPGRTLRLNPSEKFRDE
jgi:hypothetical protein